jgi:hypothetical protein
VSGIIIETDDLLAPVVGLGDETSMMLEGKFYFRSHSEV